MVNPLVVKFDEVLAGGGRGREGGREGGKVDEYDNSFAVFAEKGGKQGGREGEGAGWVTAVTTRRLSSGKHVWEYLVQKCSKGNMAIGIMTPSSLHSSSSSLQHLGKQPHSFAWRSDGTLWANGKQVASGYGSSSSSSSLHSSSPHLITDGDVITVTLDLPAHVLSFSINGLSLGPAFGPPSSHPCASLPLPLLLPPREGGREEGGFYPAISLCDVQDRVTVRPGGTVGTLVLPLLLDLESMMMSVGGMWAAALTAGPTFTREERKWEKWARSPLFALGMEGGGGWEEEEEGGEEGRRV